MDTTNKTTALLSEVTPMIRRYAKRLASQSGGAAEADDLAQVGMMAALKAAESYDPTAGTTFRTWCWHPVGEEMTRARNASCSVVSKVSRCPAKDVLFSAPVRGGDTDDETVGDRFVDPKASVEELAMKAEREVKVRAIVARVRQGWKDAALFDDLLARLMESYFAGEGQRTRSATSFAEIAARHGCTRQNVDAREKRLYRELTTALAHVAQEA